MNTAENMLYALRSGVLVAGMTAGAILLVVRFAPEDLKLLAALITGVTLIAFWGAFLSRLTGSDILQELGLCYPDLRPEASIHKELKALHEAVASLERQLARR